MHNKAKYWSRIASVYDATYSSEWSKFENGELCELVQSVRPSREKLVVLDLGCGTGLGLYIAASTCNVAEYRGYDISAEMLEIAAKKAEGYAVESEIVLRFSLSDAIDALRCTKDGSVDIVFALNCVGSYIGRTRRLLSEIGRVLKPGGAAIVSFLNRYSIKRLVSMSCFNSSSKIGSRGLSTVEADVCAVLPTSVQLTRRLERVCGISHRIWYQSVLGGVWEHKFAIPLEQFIRSLAPQFGYTQNVVIVRDRGC